ncbi:MAG TPA: HAMP domain-containing sensor histidine kinase [Polyangia bacterium]|nr:HAMP domain-containing sensor histidine kinase [Polyangia bacterium]
MTRVRVIAACVALALFVALALPWLFQWIMHLSPEEAAYTRRAFLIGAPLTLVGLTVTALLGLRGIDAPPPDERARSRVLALPFRLALVTVVGGELATVGAMIYDQLYGRTPLPMAVGLVLCTSAMIALVAVPLYALARAALVPLAQRHASEAPPRGRPLSLRIQLGYTVFAVATAALVPATVFGMAQLDDAATADAHARAEKTAARLAASAAELGVAEATRLATRTPLAGRERVILRAPSGSLIPEDAAEEVAGEPYVERALGGQLAGGMLRVYYAPRPLSPVALMAVTMGLLLLALVVASTVGSAVARDARGVADQIARVADGEEPQPLGAVATTEVRRVAMAVNRLLERIPRLTVESFLAVERADEARRLKSQFLANMSHDLRSPLNSILGFSELLLRGLEGEISPGQRVVLAAVHATGLNLLRLLTEILDTAKVESGKMELHRQSTPPAEVLTQAQQEARRGRPATIADKLTVELQAGMGPIYVDPLRMTQAITHLLNYALDAAVGGRVTLHVAEGEEADNRVLVIDLAHAGVLLESDRKHVFDNFRRLDGGQGGLNLALPLCKRIFELHGGSIDLSDPKPGDEGRPRFRAVIPVGIRREKATPTRGVPRIP